MIEPASVFGITALGQRELLYVADRSHTDLGNSNMAIIWVAHFTRLGDFRGHGEIIMAQGDLDSLRWRAATWRWGSPHEEIHPATVTM